MNFSFASMEEARAKEKSFNEFFMAIKSIIQEQQSALYQGPQKWEKEEADLNQEFIKLQVEIDLRLKDNFDTVGAVHFISEIVKLTNSYLFKKKANSSAFLLKRIAAYINKIFSVFGFGNNTSSDCDFSFLQANITTAGTENTLFNREEVLHPYVSVLSKFRSDVREAAMKKSDSNVFLQLCDSLRDETLPNLGVRIQDNAAVPYVFADPQQLKREIQLNKEAARENQLKKLKSQLQQVQKDIETWEKKKVPSQDLFKNNQNYSQFDERGLPTHDTKGNPLPASQKKKIEKQVASQETAFKSYLEKTKTQPDFFDQLTAKKTQLLDAIARLETAS